jgi:hypothetical protein
VRPRGVLRFRRHLLGAGRRLHPGRAARGFASPRGVGPLRAR